MFIWCRAKHGRRSLIQIACMSPPMEVDVRKIVFSKTALRGLGHMLNAPARKPVGRRIVAVMNTVALNGEVPGDDVVFDDVPDLPFCRRATLYGPDRHRVDATAAFTAVSAEEFRILFVRIGAGFGPADRNDIIAAFEEPRHAL